MYKSLTMFLFIFPVLSPAATLNYISAGHGSVEKNTEYRGWAISKGELVKIHAKSVKEAQQTDMQEGKTTIKVVGESQQKVEVAFGIEVSNPKSFKSATHSGNLDKGKAFSKMDISLGKKKYRLERKVIPKEKKVEVNLISIGKILKKQTVYSCNYTGKTSVCGDDGNEDHMWSGDLDGDKKLDLILRLTPKYSYDEYYLFSSKGSGKDLVKEVAKDTSSGC